MIHFSCQHCGTHLAVYEHQAGKCTTCPSCHLKVTIPSTSSKSTANGSAPNDLYDADLLEIPEIADIPGTQAYAQALAKEAQAESEKEVTVLPQRPYPWPVDIFLFPLNKGGLLTLGTMFGTLLVCGMIVCLTWLITRLIPILIILLAIVVWIAFLVLVLMSLYYVWYMCECLRYSAEGYIRTPDTLGMAPGLMELFGQLLYIFIDVLLFIALNTALDTWLRPTGWATWLMQAGLLYLFLMTLLCVIITDSLAGLNPLLSLSAIYHTWPCFTVLVGFVGCMLAVPVALWQLLTRIGLLSHNGWSLMGTMICLYPYLLLVAAHVMGCFYFRYEDNMKWDV
jgi:hypothetical protein